jgi:phage terminase small subunit
MALKNKAPHGGARAGAGRPKNPPELITSIPVTDDARTFLMALMNDSEADIKLRLEAAKCLMPYQHAKPSQAGKKIEQANAAQKVIASGKFAASAPPLRSVR